MKFLRVNKKRQCPVCNYADWCGISEDGNVVACMRVSSGNQAKNGAYLHFQNDESQPKTAPKRIEQQVKIVPEYVTRSSDEINEIYSAFLDRLVLANNHKADLERRGLGFISVDLHGYKSMPTPLYGEKICCQLINNGYDLNGVPGFYKRNDVWRFVDYRRATGYLIPIRNRKHQICALQLRRDDNQTPKYLIISSGWQQSGTPSGAPPHFATLGKPIKREQVKEIIVTEGALKANISACFVDMPIVGLVSVSTFNETLPEILKEAYPNLAIVKIAFDSDALENEAVKAQRCRLSGILNDAGIEPRILSWNRQFKGLDDYLTAKKNSSHAAQLAA